MGTTVCKFGGSSLADASQFKKVREIVFADEARRFVVPSAPGKRTYRDEKITDMLYACQKKAQEGKPFKETFDCIVERYVDIAFELELRCDILPYLEEVRAVIAAGTSPDFAASRGEYLCGLLLSDYLGFEFIDAAEIVRFDENGVFDSLGTQRATQARLKTVKNAIIPGFYGCKPNGDVKTFSRGGSDISGAIVARGADADIYENWTDVSGFLMADPHIVKDPKHIEVITYRELRELAYMGANVLHEESIFPVREASIPINIKNTNMPDDVGTFIVPETDARVSKGGTVTGVAGRKGFTVIAVEKDKMNTEIGFARRVLSALEHFGISLEHMPTGIDTLSVVIADSQLKGRGKELCDKIMSDASPDSVELYDNLALIATVGRGMIHKIGTSARLFTALAENSVNVRMIDQGSSEFNIIVGVKADDFEKAVNAIYRAFVEV